MAIFLLSHATLLNAVCHNDVSYSLIRTSLKNVFSILAFKRPLASSYFFAMRVGTPPALLCWLLTYPYPKGGTLLSSLGEATFIVNCL
ncbi:MAG: hypothetical protein K0S27_1692 [Gammaproteobacteria bacterium]|jgi:hypothetical protein|nr:hypothetical protein [Gammaproteobacteria bacterium]